jgi:hypothetical protein
VDGLTRPYIKIKNTGVYPIRITGIIGADGGKATLFNVPSNQPSCNPSSSGGYNISDYYYLAPGEEKYFGWNVSVLSGLSCQYQIKFSYGPTAYSVVGGASSICINSTTNPGILEYKTFGFEYSEYVEGKEIVKKQLVLFR